MKKTISGVTIECVKGNIVLQSDIAAIVNAANAELKMGGGVAGAIHKTAGPGLEKECRPLAPINPGEAVITGAYDLPNMYVIHCLGPVYEQDKPEPVLLADCYKNALKLAEQKRIDSVAFPAISTGAFGYPIEDAAETALKTIRDIVSSLKHVKTIRFVLYNQKSVDVHEEVLKSIGI